MVIQKWEVLKKLILTKEFKTVQKRYPAVYIRMLQRAHEFSSTLVAKAIEALESQLTKSNDFENTLLDKVQFSLKIYT